MLLTLEFVHQFVFYALLVCYIRRWQTSNTRDMSIICQNMHWHLSNTFSESRLAFFGASPVFWVSFRERQRECNADTVSLETVKNACLERLHTCLTNQLRSSHGFVACFVRHVDSDCHFQKTDCISFFGFLFAGSTSRRQQHFSRYRGTRLEESWLFRLGLVVGSSPRGLAAHACHALVRIPGDVRWPSPTDPSKAERIRGTAFWFPNNKSLLNDSNFLL